MGRKFEIVVIALMVICVAGTGAAIAHQKNVIDTLRSDAIASLEKEVSLDDYRKAQKKEVSKILDKYEKQLAEVRTQEEADKLIADAKAEAKPIKTDAQLTKIEKKKAAEKAKKEAERKAAEEAAAAEAAAEAARQAEQERQQSYSYSNSGSSSGNSGGSSGGSGGSSNGSSKPSNQSDGCVDPDADLI